MISRKFASCLRRSLKCASAKDVLLQAKYKLCEWNRLNSTNLKCAIEESLRAHREIIAKFRKEKDDTTIGEIKVKNIYGGMRGLTAMIYETSLVNPDTGILYRNYTIPEIREKLPKGCNGEEPLPEGLFWLLCTGCIPNDEQAKWVTKAWNERSQVPEYILEMLLNLPKNLHPMSKLSAAVTAMNLGNCLGKAIDAGEKKAKLWEYMYEDVMNLLGKLTSVAAVIYTSSFRDCALKPIVEKDKDWSENFCLNMGFDDSQFVDYIRLYLCLHSDHEGGNVSAHTVHLVSSALSDAYLSFAAGVNGLAGPLHGLANQEVIKFILEINKEFGEQPTDDQLKQFCEKKLKEGIVIPGYGHAVLRQTDPRFTSLMNFAAKHAKDDKMVKIVAQLFKVVPPILTASGKAKNPCPNVDAHSGALLQHYGMKEMNFYTVLFAVSRALGTLSWLIWARGLGLPLERPKSVTTEALMKMIEPKKSVCPT